MNKDTCILYDYSEVIDNILFYEKLKPVIIIIADEINVGITRAKYLTNNQRVLKSINFTDIPDGQRLYKIISQNIFLYKTENIYYFVYPKNLKTDLLTIYCQNKLMKNNFGVMFNFLNLENTFPYWSEIIIPVKPHSLCTNCTFQEYVKEKLKSGESFSELFDIHKQLFSQKEHVFFNKPINIVMFYYNLYSNERESTTYFNTLMTGIEYVSKNSRQNGKSLACFNLKYSDKENFNFLKNSDFDKYYVRRALSLIDYMNLLKTTILSLNASDSNTFENLCNIRPYSNLIKLFCFIKNLSNAQSHKTLTWINRLENFLSDSLISQLSWFDKLVDFYKKEYELDENTIIIQKQNLNKMLRNVDEKYEYWMNTTYFAVDYGKVSRTLLIHRVSKTNDN